MGRCDKDGPLALVKMPIAIDVGIFYNIVENKIKFPWPTGAQVDWPAEQDNGVRIPTLPAL